MLMSVLIAACVAGPLVGLWLAVLWRGTRRIERVPGRRLARGLCLVLGLVLWTAGALVLSPLVPYDSGTWSCLVCGREEKRWELRWELACVPLSRSVEPVRPGSPGAWYEERVGLAHEHEWISTGCHVTSSGFACSFGGGFAGDFLSLLAGLPDAEVARQLATKLARLPSGQRTAWLNDLRSDLDPSNPFSRLRAGEVLSAQEFDAGFAAWLERHPRWR